LTKVDFIQQNKLGGAMWWEVSGDKNDTGSIISNVSPHLAKFPHGCVFPQ
jgi:chitinase